MTINYLPFQRRETVQVPPALADRVLTGGFAVSNLARMATGGTKRAIIQDMIVYAPDDMYETVGAALRMRVGVDGRNYMTEDLYDYRVFMDVTHPLKAMWNWSCGGRTPYRLYPGQKMTVLMSPSPYYDTRSRPNVPISVVFSGLKVPNGSQVGTKDGEPFLMYGTVHPPQTGWVAGELIHIDSPRFLCPKDGPVDLYSVTLPDYEIGGTPTGQIVYILVGIERPFWDCTQWPNMLYSLELGI